MSSHPPRHAAKAYFLPFCFPSRKHSHPPGCSVRRPLARHGRYVNRHPSHRWLRNRYAHVRLIRHTKKIAPGGTRRSGGACSTKETVHKIMTGASSRHWRSVAHSYWCPCTYEASCGFPFPLLPRVARLKKSFFKLLSPSNHVDICSFTHVDTSSGDGRHTTLCKIPLLAFTVKPLLLNVITGPVLPAARPESGFATQSRALPPIRN